MIQVVAYRVQHRLSEMQQDRQQSSSITAMTSSTSIYSSATGMSASEHGVKGSSNNSNSSNTSVTTTSKEPLCLPVLELSQAKGLAKQLGCDPKVPVYTYN
jgi:hypothetical protein